MTLTPEQFMTRVPTGTLDEGEKQNADQWEKAIETLLMTGTIRSVPEDKEGVLRLNISHKAALKVDPTLPKASAGVRWELRRRYLKAGWSRLEGSTTQIQLVYKSKTDK